MQLLIVTLLVVTYTVLGQEKKLGVNITSDTFTITVFNSEEWFHSGPVKVHNDGKWLSTTDGSLILGNKSTNSSEDHLGPYEYYSFNYHNSSKEFSFTMFIKLAIYVYVAIYRSSEIIRC